MTSPTVPPPAAEPQTTDRPTLSENCWLLPTLKAITSLPWENDNWCTGGHRTNPTAVANLIAVLVKVGDDRMPPPHIVPAWDGGVQAEWHRNGVDLEIDIATDGTAEFFFIDPDGAEHEKNALENIDELIQYIQAII